MRPRLRVEQTDLTHPNFSSQSVFWGARSVALIYILTQLTLSKHAQDFVSTCTLVACEHGSCVCKGVNMIN